MYKLLDNLVQLSTKKYAQVETFREQEKEKQRIKESKNDATVKSMEGSRSSKQAHLTPTSTASC